jgi:histidine triad (HIT) family protein
MSACLFCRIVAGEIPATFVYEDDAVVAFRDIDPRAPVHVLVVPRRHVASVLALAPAGGAADPVLAARLFDAAAHVARAEGLDAPDKGFRVVTNSGPEGGQSVDHLHLHVLGGRALAWPPG